MGSRATGRKSSILLAFCLVLLAGPAFAQTTGTLIPFVPGNFEDNNGNPCNACKLYSYTAGTTTPLSTYQDVTLVTPHANPIVLDSAGRAPAGIYLTSSNYKFVLKTSADVTLWTRDNVAAIPYTTIASSYNDLCNGRITLTSGTAVTTADVTAATTVYFTPYKGNRCALYDGAQWNISSFTELSLSLGSDTADTNYDLFLYLSSGTPTLERVAWSSSSARATNITLQNGVYVKASDTTRRYLGTYRTTGVAGQTEDSNAKRFIWNMYNRVRRGLRAVDGADSWTYTTAAYRQANNSTGNQVAVVVGVAESLVSLTVQSFVSNSGGAVAVAVGIGVDSTTNVTSGVIGMGNSTNPTAGTINPISARYDGYVAIGYHTLTWLEQSTASGTTTWYGDNAAPTIFQSGLTGFIEG
jgi:hypothetical protein